MENERAIDPVKYAAYHAAKSAMHSNGILLTDFISSSTYDAVFSLVEKMFLKEFELESQIAGLQTELTVWKDTAEKLKEENENGKQRDAMYLNLLEEMRSKLQQRDELLERILNILDSEDGNLLTSGVMIQKISRVLNDYQNLKK